MTGHGSEAAVLPRHIDINTCMKHTKHGSMMLAAASPAHVSINVTFGIYGGHSNNPTH